MESSKNFDLSKRDWIKSVVATTLSVYLYGCKIQDDLFNPYLKKLRENPELEKSILIYFVDAVIPGVDLKDSNLVKIFYDLFFPFAPYRTGFAADLAQYSKHLFANDLYYELPRISRQALVQDGLESRTPRGLLYSGAIFLTQISVYSGIYDDQKGCPLIEYPGKFQFVEWTELTHPDPEYFRGIEKTVDGNPE